MKNEVLIDIRNVSVKFNKSSENITGLKEYIIKFLKKELMFEEFYALKDVSLQIKKGESWGLIGTNGSGKSTLLKVISGILKASEGSVRVKGNISPLIELGAGFNWDLTARENIFLNGVILGYRKKFIQEKFDEIVAFSELEQFLDMPIKNFSSGMAARLGFAIATVVKPEILVVDEVLAVGDIAFQQKCQKRMQEMLSDGTTLLFVSHTADQVKSLCNKTLWLEKGIVMAKGNTDSIIQQYCDNLGIDS